MLGSREVIGKEGRVVHGVQQVLRTPARPRPAEKDRYIWTAFSDGKEAEVFLAVARRPIDHPRPAQRKIQSSIGVEDRRQGVAAGGHQSEPAAFGGPNCSIAGAAPSSSGQRDR